MLGLWVHLSASLLLAFPHDSPPLSITSSPSYTWRQAGKRERESFHVSLSLTGRKFLPAVPGRFQETWASSLGQKWVALPHSTSRKSSTCQHLPWEWVSAVWEYSEIRGLELMGILVTCRSFLRWCVAPPAYGTPHTQWRRCAPMSLPRRLFQPPLLTRKLCLCSAFCVSLRGKCLSGQQCLFDFPVSHST